MTLAGGRAPAPELPRPTRPEARAAAAQLLAMRGDGTPVPAVRSQAIERFYRREARLLDEERYEEWYALLADDLFYWMPLRENRYRRDRRPAIDPENVALFDDSKADMALRVGRLASTRVWTEDPPGRHVFLVTNLEAFATDAEDEFEVHSAFLQYRNRSEHDETTLAGRRRDLLRADGDSFLLARRLILLPQSVLLAKNLSVFF